MKKLFFIALAAASLALSACSSVYPVCATSNPVGGKVGTATAGHFLFIPIPFSGDSSIRRAAQESGITKISTVDTKVFSYLGIWWGRQTIVTGE